MLGCEVSWVANSSVAKRVLFVAFLAVMDDGELIRPSAFAAGLMTDPREVGGAIGSY